jgi:hypothetical protein
MIAYVRAHAVTFVVGGALALAGVSGFFVSKAIGAAQQAPATTVTVDVGTGEQGPPGPKGDTGPMGPAGTAGGGAEACPTGSTFGAVRINSPGGHVTIWTCVANE